MPIVRKTNVVGQAAVGIVVEADVVGEVDEERALGTDAAGKFDGVIDEHVGMVLALEAQSIDDERFHTCETGSALVGNRFHVGDIGEIAETIGQNRHFSVHHLDGLPLDVANFLGLTRLDGMQIEARNTRIEFFGEAIRHRNAQGGSRRGVGIDVDVAENAKTAQVVHSSHVVVVDVGEQHAVDFPKRQRHQLHPNVGTAVDEQARRVGFQQSHATKTAVARVATPTNFTLTAQNGYARRSSCA